VRRKKPQQLQLALVPQATENEHRYLSNFAAALAKHAPEAQWTALVRELVAVAVELPADCGCTDPRVQTTWRHQHHGAYNTAVRAAIIAAGAREGMLNGVRVTGSGDLLQDFLSVKPTIEWFKENR
jgi:hypothetical protein